MHDHPLDRSVPLSCPPAAAICPSPRRLVSWGGAKSISSLEQIGIGAVTANLIKTAIYMVFFFVSVICSSVISKCALMAIPSYYLI